MSIVARSLSHGETACHAAISSAFIARKLLNRLMVLSTIQN
jgi:hypothetical protein